MTSDYRRREMCDGWHTVTSLSAFPRLEPATGTNETDLVPLMDPYAILAEHPDLTLCFDRLPAGERGRFYTDLNAIVISDRLNQAERRCTLMHELVHRMRGDFHVSDDLAHHRQEKTCHQTAARTLIPFPTLLAAMQWDRDEDELCQELFVDRETLQARICGLTEHEALALRDRVGPDEWSVA